MTTATVAPPASSSGVWRSVVTNVAATYATQIVRVALGLATVVAITRALGPVGRGEYAVAAALALLGVQFGTFGLHSSNTYFSARQPQALGGLLANSLAVSATVGTVASLAALALSYLLPAVLPVRGPLLALAVLFVPVTLAYTLMQSLLLGTNRVGAYNAAEIATKLLTLLFVILTLTLSFRTPAAALAACVVAQFLVLAAVSARLGQSVPKARVCWSLLKDNFRYGGKAYLAALFCFLVLRIDLLMVRKMAGAEPAGYYAVAASMADYIILLPTVIGSIIFPRLSAMSSLDSKLRLTRRTVLNTAALMLPLLALAAVLSTRLVALLFGTAFLPAAAAFVWLVPGMFALAVHLVAVQFLNSVGYPWSVVITWGACFALNVALNLWAIPHHGIVGASAVSSISYFVAAAAILVLVWQYARHDSEPS